MFSAADPIFGFGRPSRAPKAARNAIIEVPREYGCGTCGGGALFPITYGSGLGKEQCPHPILFSSWNGFPPMYFTCTSPNYHRVTTGKYIHRRRNNSTGQAYSATVPTLLGALTVKSVCHPAVRLVGTGRHLVPVGQTSSSELRNDGGWYSHNSCVALLLQQSSAFI